MTEYEVTVDRAVAAIRERTGVVPTVGLILGSGLGDFTKSLENAAAISLCDIPGMPLTAVEGHGGSFILGDFAGKKIAVLDGRTHYYEGRSQREITFPVRVMARLGVKTLIITNAAGGINTDFRPGDIMLISDHINMSGDDPLIGPNLDSFGPRFPDMSAVYTLDLRSRVKAEAEKLGVPLVEGVYVMYSGPNYETPAEIRFFRAIGGDAVGMSTVPEAIVAAHCGMAVIGFSCITNMAAGVLDRKLDHGEVLEAAKKAGGDFRMILDAAIRIA